MVVVPGALVLEVTSAKELLASIQSGQNHRHVASTQVPCHRPCRRAQGLASEEAGAN